MTGSTIAAAETTLCRIIAELLDLELVGPQDGFFEVGGDSVLALQVVARARDAGLELTVRDLFDHQTPESLAAAMDGRTATAAGTSVFPETPLLAFTDDELAEFEDTEIGEKAEDVEAGWETVT